MPEQKLSKSEERHRKQKEKLLAKNTVVEVESGYKSKKNLKVSILEEANSLGYTCVFDSGTLLMFKHKDKDKVDEWLMNKYGRDENGVKRIPFSYGFN